MGACASKPKDLECNQAPIPSEAPTTPKNPVTHPVPQENNNGGAVENKMEEPLVDISTEPAGGAGEEATKNVEEEAKVVSEEASEVTMAKPSSEVLEEENKKKDMEPAAPAPAPAEDKVNEAQKEAMEPAKEAEKKVVPDQDQVAKS